MQIDTNWKGFTVHYLDWWIKTRYCDWQYRFTFEVKRWGFSLYWKSRLPNRIFTVSPRHFNLSGLVLSWQP